MSNATIQCNGRGRCETKVNGQSCACDYGFTGLYCEYSKFFLLKLYIFARNRNTSYELNTFVLSTDIDDCLPNPCQNNGVCLDGDGKFTCKCSHGWTGNFF